MAHYVRYRKDERGNELQSRPGNFGAWAHAREAQPGWIPPVREGDIVWILSGAGGQKERRRYRLDAVFKAEGSPVREGDRLWIRGTKGTIFQGGIEIGHEPWFETFFTRIGRGGTGFQRLPEEQIDFFQSLLDASLSEDRLEELTRAASDRRDEQDVLALRAVKLRRGQDQFRRALLDAYDHRCCFSGCDVEEVLEAAHIVEHFEETNYRLSNGLLLRADIHTLFDLRLIGVDEWDRIQVSKKLMRSEYSKLQGQRIRLPRRMGDRPSQRGLARRLEEMRAMDD